MARKEPYTVGSILHIYNRGNRKQIIVRDERDRWRFLEMLYYFNDSNAPRNVLNLIHEQKLSNFARPKSWKTREPIVNILGFCLRDNHYHLIIEEIQEGGVTTFMRKLGTGMTNYYNRKYNEVGSLFQGAFKSKTVADDYQLRWLAAYVMVKNVFEMHPDGYSNATQSFASSLQWALQYKFSSLADYASERSSKIIDKSVLGQVYDNHMRFIEDAEQQISYYSSLSETLSFD